MSVFFFFLFLLFRFLFFLLFFIFYFSGSLSRFEGQQRVNTIILNTSLLFHIPTYFPPSSKGSSQIRELCTTIACYLDRSCPASKRGNPQHYQPPNRRCAAFATNFCAADAAPKERWKSSKVNSADIHSPGARLRETGDVLSTLFFWTSCVPPLGGSSSALKSSADGRQYESRVKSSVGSAPLSILPCSCVL